MLSRGSTINGAGKAKVQLARLSSPMSSLMGNHGVALATATAMALSGTLIAIAICRQRPLSTTPGIRACITSGTRKVERTDSKKTKKKKKRVTFGEDVVVEFDDDNESGEMVETAQNVRCDLSKECKMGEMPANRAALYNGIMQARLQRMACY